MCDAASTGAGLVDWGGSSTVDWLMANDDWDWRRCWLRERPAVLVLGLAFVWVLERTEDPGRRFFSGWVRKGAFIWAGMKRRTTPGGGWGVDESAADGTLALLDAGRIEDEDFERLIWIGACCVDVQIDGVAADICLGFFSPMFYSMTKRHV